MKIQDFADMEKFESIMSDWAVATGLATVAVGADGTPTKKMKGTGTLFTKNVVSQSAKSGFSSFMRTALRPEHVQKRRLEENLSFTATAKPEPGTATLAKLYEEVQKRYPDFKI